MTAIAGCLCNVTCLSEDNTSTCFRYIIVVCFYEYWLYTNGGKIYTQYPHMGSPLQDINMMPIDNGSDACDWMNMYKYLQVCIARWIYISSILSTHNSLLLLKKLNEYYYVLIVCLMCPLLYASSHSWDCLYMHILICKSVNPVYAPAISCSGSSCMFGYILWLLCFV